MARNVSRMNAGVNGPQVYDVLEDIIALVNELRTDHATFQLAIDGIVAKLDADSGITDTNYEAIHGVGGSGAALPATLTAAAVALVE